MTGFVAGFAGTFGLIEPGNAIAPDPDLPAIEIEDVFVLNHPLGPILKVKLVSAQVGATTRSNVQAEIKTSREETILRFGQCSMTSELKKRLKQGPLFFPLGDTWGLKVLVAQEKPYCEVSVLTPVAFAIFSPHVQTSDATALTYQGFFTPQDEKIHVLESQFWHSLLNEEEQGVLREKSRALGGFAQHPYVKQFFLSGLSTGNFGQTIALAHGLCFNARHEFFPELKKLGLIEQLTATPDEHWVKACMQSLEVFYRLDPMLKAESQSQGTLPVAPLQLSDVEPYLYFPGRQGNWVEQFIRLSSSSAGGAEAGVSAPKDDPRRAVLLLLKSRKRGSPSEVIEWAEKVQWPQGLKSMTFNFVDLDNGGRVEQVKVTEVNIKFLKAESLGKLKKDREAKVIYEEVAKLPAKVIYEHFDGGEKYFALPASIYGQSLLALSLFKLGEKNLACQSWVDLAWKHAKSLFTGFEFEESLCNYNLQFVQDYCQKEIQFLNPRKAGFAKTPASCREVWGKVFSGPGNPK